ncbi:hypothetical protein K3495_g6954 [Podosphaera aphanis]|nr:hypothetical protein K3495_g6954 [Podosphaera aphanis]
MAVQKESKSRSRTEEKESQREKKRKLAGKSDETQPRSKKHKTSGHTRDFSPDTCEEISPFHLQTSSLYLPLAPVSQRYPIEGICAEHLSPLILTYYPPFNGLILSYSNPRLSETPFEDDGETVLMKSIDEYAVSWTWVTAEFLILKPEKGVWLEGHITLQNDGHLGVVCWNLFNASIERKRLPRDWEWRDVSENHEFQSEIQNEELPEPSGFYVDKLGKRVEGMVKFRVADIESSQDRERGFLTIVGTMLDVEEELALVMAENAGGQDGKSAGRRLGGPNALGATKLGAVAENDDRLR